MEEWNKAIHPIIHPSIVVIVGDKPTYSSAPKRAIQRKS